MSRFSHKKSKRVSCKKKYKIQKKIKEHHKKLKREAKKNPKPKGKSKTKDPGVPNSVPFKEDILREAELRRQKADEAKQRQKEERKAAQNKNRPGLEDMQKHAQKRATDFERKKEENEAAANTESTGPKNKSYYKEFRKIVEAADVVLEVLDARDPLGTRCAQVEEAVLSSGTNKKLVLLLNKIDLVPKDILLQWLKYLRNEFPTLPFKASTQTQQTNLSRSRVAPQHRTENFLRTSLCVGAGALMKLLGNYCRNQDIRTTISVGVVGFPNVGKSSIINSLKRSKACAVGGTPGVTKCVQEVLLDSHIKLLDSPGVVLAKGKSEASSALRNALKLETLHDPVLPTEAILARANKEQLMLHYRLGTFSTTIEFLSLLGNRLGRLKKGGVPDIMAAARKLLQDWNSGRIKYYTHPPEQHQMPSYLSAEIVSEMGKAFDIDSVLEEEGKQIANVSIMIPSQAVIISSDGIMDADETITQPEVSGAEATMDVEEKDMTVSFPSKTKSKQHEKEQDPGGVQLNRKAKKAFQKMQRKKRKLEKKANQLSEKFEEITMETEKSETNKTDLDTMETEKTGSSELSQTADP